LQGNGKELPFPFGRLTVREKPLLRHSTRLTIRSRA
jgi:hypothetical protein